VTAPVTVREFGLAIVKPFATAAALIVTVFATAVVSTVTVAPELITTSSAARGT
jgi:hypothetical protein